MSKRVDFDEFTENYNTLLNESTHFFSSNEAYFAKYKVDIARHHIKRPVARILEYGCGIGRNIPFLQAAFPHATIMGSDISAGSLEIAREQNPGIEFFQENGAEQFNKFDLIFVAGVFHHIPPAERSFAAATLLDRLSPNGEVMVFEHNPYNPITRKIVNNCPYDEDAVLLAPYEMKKYLKKAGFLINKQSYCLFFPPRFSSLTPMESRLGWLPLGGQYWVHAQCLK